VPITKSAKKALRQSRQKRVFNLRCLRQMKTAIKQTEKLIKQGSKKQALETLSQVYKAIDKAAKKGLIKKNAASRKKSRLTKAITKIDIKN